MKVPAIPYVAINDIAIPGEYFLEPDANVNVMGTIAAVPNPTRQKPSIDIQKPGKVTAMIIPLKINKALTTNSFGIPILSIMLSHANRESAMQIINDR